MARKRISVEQLIPLLEVKLRRRVSHLSDAAPDEHTNSGVVELYRELGDLAEASEDAVDRRLVRVTERIRKRVRDDRERGVRTRPVGGIIEEYGSFRDPEQELEDRRDLATVLEFLQAHPDGYLLLLHRVEGWTLEKLASQETPPTSVRTIQRRIDAVHKALLRSLGRERARCIAIALLLFDAPSPLAPGPDSRAPSGADAPTKPPARRDLGWPLAIGFGVLSAFVGWFGLRSCEPGAPSPRASANPVAWATRPLPGVPLSPDEPAVAPVAEVSRAADTEGTVAAEAVARHKSRRAARPLGRLAERCFPALHEPGAILERVQVATMLLEWAPPTAEELADLAGLRDLGPAWRFQDIDPPARSATELSALLEGPPSAETADCGAIGAAAIYIGALRRVFTGEGGGCFGRPDQPACRVDPDSPINAAALVTVACRALFNDPDAPPSDIVGSGECHPAFAPHLWGTDPVGWPSNLWYSGPPRVLLASFPESRPDLLVWLEGRAPDDVVSAADADALFDLLPR